MRHYQLTVIAFLLSDFLPESSEIGIAATFLLCSPLIRKRCWLVDVGSV